MKATGNFEKAQHVDPMVALTDATRAHIDLWAAKFPPERKRSAVIQGLMAAQDQNGGWLTDEIIAAVAKALGRKPDDLTVAVLDRPRHTGLVESIRTVGARIKFLGDGDVAGAIMAASEDTIDTGVDLLFGTGGTPEGVIAAAALRCLGGSIFARLAPRNDEERQAAIDQGYDLDRILTTTDLCGGEDIFFAATGVTDGALLKGVRYGTGRISTTSLSMRARSGTIRFIQTFHDPERSSLVPSLD
jgi:fructose-1,6-bisphosphatase II